MKKPIFLLALLILNGCGGCGDTLAPAPPPPPEPTPDPPPEVTDPAPSAFFIDATGQLPDARNNDCFDARAFDAEGDGDLDLFLAAFSLNGARNRLFVNDGTGSFTDPDSLPPNLGISEHVAVGDFDMDGDLDIVVANVNSDPGDMHEYYLNTGSGPNFELAPQGLPVAGLSAFVVARDVDTDNDLDLFFSNFGRSDLLLNDGIGNFNEAPAGNLPGNDPEITEDSGVGDVNGDGFDDIFLAYRGSASEGQGLQNRLWLNNGLGVFTDVTDTNLPTIIDSTFDIQLADVDGDGDLDALIANATIGDSNRPLADSLLINDGNGIFTDETAARWPQATLSNTYGVLTIDLDRDGDLDILTAENLGATSVGTVRAFANDGTGVFSEQTDTLIGTVVGNMVHLEAADFDGDGLLDVYFCATRNFGAAGSGRDFLFLAQ
ncbi:MAG: VCBS repeat-containing protein [Pseudomonadota bacterium]